MAEICPVCGEEINSENREVYKTSNDSAGIPLHDNCLTKYVSKPEKYSGTAEEAEEWSHLICPVCEEDLDTQVDKIWYPISDMRVHDRCNKIFKQDPERYGGVNADLDFANKEAQEEQAKQAEANFNKIIEQSKIDETSLQEIKDKSVYIKGFSMPFGEMVIFALKWMLAMIPALILFWIIIALFTALFGVSLMSIFL